MKALGQNSLHHIHLGFHSRSRESVPDRPATLLAPSAVLRVVLQTLDEFCDRVAVEADLVNGGEEGKPRGQRDSDGHSTCHKIIIQLRSS